MSSFGFGGANAHVVIKPHFRENINNFPPQNHRLVLASGRTDQAVKHFLDEVQKNGNDHQFLGLLDEIYKTNIEGHYHRG